MKIKLDYNRLKAYAESKGIKKLSDLCRRADIKYGTLLNNRYLDNSISIETAWKLSNVLECSINDIVRPEDEGGE